LIEQFANSGKNAVLVVPNGPANSKDSFGGKLEEPGGLTRLVDEILLQLRERQILSGTNHGVGDIILTGHSGGYRVMAKILEADGLAENVREVWIFDGLYALTENFFDWQSGSDRRWVTLYTTEGGTLEEIRNAKSQLEERGVAFAEAHTDDPLSPEVLTNRIVFVHSSLPHGDVVAKGGRLGQFLETSCLEEE
jgi:hypothetical protein